MIVVVVVVPVHFSLSIEVLSSARYLWWPD